MMIVCECRDCRDAAYGQISIENPRVVQPGMYDVTREGDNISIKVLHSCASDTKRVLISRTMARLLGEMPEEITT